MLALLNAVDASLIMADADKQRSIPGASFPVAACGSDMRALEIDQVWRAAVRSALSGLVVPGPLR